MSEPLKPCPICEGVIFTKGIIDPDHLGYDECQKCGARLPTERRNNRPGEKAASLHELNELREYFPLTARAHYDGMQIYITERIAKLEAPDAK